MFRQKGEEHSAADWRIAMERAAQEKVATREKFIAAQSAPQYGPQIRIRLWEQLHAMHLPRDANHRLIRVIAAQTALSVEQIRQEQSRRADEVSRAATESVA